VAQDKGRFASERTTTFVTVSVDAVPEMATSTVGASITVLTGGEAGRLIFVGPDGGTLGRGSTADFPFPEESISRHHARLILADGHYQITDLGSLNGTFVNGQRIVQTVYLPEKCRIQIATNTILEFTALDDLGLTAVKKLSETITTDPLTGTGNRYQFQQRLQQEMHYAHRHGVPLGMLLLDLDHFKLINDQCGHPAGDQVLAEVGETLLLLVRSEDAVFRYGGEEFCILVRGTDTEGLVRLAERIREAVEQHRVEHHDYEIQATLSVGVAVLGSEHSMDEQTLLFQADKALYAAKERGRNRVVMYSESL
jgi:diguanylate cyclase (GGDEF)-like protein